MTNSEYIQQKFVRRINQFCENATDNFYIVKTAKDKDIYITHYKGTYPSVFVGWYDEDDEFKTEYLMFCGELKEYNGDDKDAIYQSVIGFCEGYMAALRDEFEQTADK